VSCPADKLAANLQQELAGAMIFAQFQEARVDRLIALSAAILSAIGLGFTIDESVAAKLTAAGLVPCAWAAAALLSICLFLCLLASWPKAALLTDPEWYLAAARDESFYTTDSAAEGEYLEHVAPRLLQQQASSYQLVLRATSFRSNLTRVALTFFALAVATLCYIGFSVAF